MPTTSNFGWTTPADTDLVKDGAAAIRTLGNGIDTSLVDLKGGTTGQVLSKTSNTDLDYTWVTPNVGDITEVQAGTGISIASGTGPIPIVTNTVATEFDAKGDLVVGTGADTFDRLAVGTNGQILVANSSTSTGLEWQTAASGGLTIITPTSTANTGGSVSTTGGAVTASGCQSLSINGVFTSTYVNYLLIIDGLTGDFGNLHTRFRASGSDTSTNYYAGLVYQTWANNVVAGSGTNNGTYFIVTGLTTSQDSGANLFIENPQTSKNTTFQGTQTKQDAMGVVGGQLRNTTSYDGITFFHENGGDDFSGTFRIYGIAN